MIEYGEIEYAPGIFDPPSTVWRGTGNLADFFTFQSLVPEMNNRSALVLAGRTVGGSSAVNGMFFDRASRSDFDAFQALGGPESDSKKQKWDWNSIYPYFKKVGGNLTISGSRLTEEYAGA